MFLTGRLLFPSFIGYIERMSTPGKRFSKTMWLEKSLEILSEEGEKKLTIDHLVKEMGVTRGSFYWHFKDRAELLDALVLRWQEEHLKKHI